MRGSRLNISHTIHWAYSEEWVSGPQALKRVGRDVHEWRCPVNHKLWSISLVCSLMLGCSVHKAQFYPVQGPLSAQTPLPVLVAKVSGVFTPANISLVLGDGEVCKGRWAQVPAIQSAKGAAAANPATSEISGAWDAVYGPGFYVSHILGARLHLQALVSGNRGTVLSAEMYRSGEGPGSELGPIKGVAKDNRGNIYKLVFAD